MIAEAGGGVGIEGGTFCYEAIASESPEGYEVGKGEPSESLDEKRKTERALRREKISQRALLRRNHRRLVKP